MFLKRVYSEICVIRVQIFILVSLLCEFVTFRRKKYSVVIHGDENTCYNIAMAQVSVAQEGKLPEMHERLIILRELLTRAAPSSRGHCAFSS